MIQMARERFDLKRYNLMPNFLTSKNATFEHPRWGGGISNGLVATAEACDRQLQETSRGLLLQYGSVGWDDSRDTSYYPRHCVVSCSPRVVSLSL